MLPFEISKGLGLYVAFRVRLSGMKLPFPEEVHFPVVVAPLTLPFKLMAGLFSQTFIVSRPASTNGEGVNTISIAGGVAKNKLLRASIDKNLKGSKIIFPSLKYCTDNAAMISYLGEKKFVLGKSSKLDFSINPNFNLKIN